MLFLAVMTGVSHATVYTFQPSSVTMGDLDHGVYYEWGIAMNLLPGEYITEALLCFSNIYENSGDVDNALYIHLLDSAVVGLHGHWDDSLGGDNFASAGPLVGVWNDVAGADHNPVYAFSTLGLIDDLTQFIANDGIFGFGIDPDCHYVNDGVKLIVKTTIPEPGSMMLMGMGLLGLVGFMKKKSV